MDRSAPERAATILTGRMQAGPIPPGTVGGRGFSVAWAAFLVMGFVVVGLAGLFASYAVPLPLERALARDAALDEALAAVRGPDAAAALAALRPKLAESAEAILPADPAGPLPPAADLVARIGSERAAFRARQLVEFAVVAERTRWLLGVLTAMAALFGVAILHIGRRG